MLILLFKLFQSSWAESLAGHGRWLPMLLAATAAQSWQPSAAASRSPAATRRLIKGRRGHAEAHNAALDIITDKRVMCARLRTIRPCVQ